MICVLHNKKEQQMFKKNIELLYIKIKYHIYNQLSILKNIYITLNSYIHPAETHRLLKFLFHKMGRLVPAHNDKPVQSS